MAASLRAHRYALRICSCPQQLRRGSIRHAEQSQVSQKAMDMHPQIRESNPILRVASISLAAVRADVEEARRVPKYV